MGGDLNKAPKMAEAMLEDLGNLQTALGMPSSSKNEEGQAEPVAEVTAMQKHIVAVKFAYLDFRFSIFRFWILGFWIPEIKCSIPDFSYWIFVFLIFDSVFRTLGLEVVTLHF